MRRRVYLTDPITLGFRLMLRAESRMARRRILIERIKFAATLAIVIVANVGSVLGTLALLAWLQGA